MVASPFTVGNQFASSYFQSKLTAHSEMPGAPVVNADGTIGTVDPNATEAQKMDARLKGAEIKNEATSNLFIFLGLGADAKAVKPSDDAPTDTEGRLTNLEKTLNEIEKQMPELAERFGIVYKPYVAPESSEAPTEQSRMDNIEKRQAYIDKKVELLKIIQNQKAG
nr:MULTISPECIES: type III secretion effector protein [Pseudomonas]